MPSSYLHDHCGKNQVHSFSAAGGGAPGPGVVSNNTASNVEFILINTYYGSFRYSDAFKQELISRGYVGDACSDRSHPLVIALFDEKGTDWSSGTFASIEKVAVPAGFAKYVTIVQDEGESIHVDFDRAFAVGTEELVSQPNAIMDDVRALKVKIDAAKKVWESCRPVEGTSDIRPNPSDEVVVANDKNKVHSLLFVLSHIFTECRSIFLLTSYVLFLETNRRNMCTST